VAYFGGIQDVLKTLPVDTEKGEGTWSAFFFPLESFLLQFHFNRFSSQLDTTLATWPEKQEG